MNRVVHFEIHATDPDTLEKFYKELFGWEFQHMGSDYMDYRVIKTGPMAMPGAPLEMKDMGINGGLMKRPGPSPAKDSTVAGFVNIIGVEDCDGTFAKALTLGASEAMKPYDIPKIGRVAYLRDPDNNIFGILQPSPDMTPK